MADTPAKKILALCGSLRKESFNRKLLNAAVENAPNRMQIEIYEEMASLPLFNEDLEKATGGGPEVVRRLREIVKAADGVLIATPEYNQSIPGVLKNAIDWLSRTAPDDIMEGKPVAMMGASSGRWGTRLSQAATRQVLFSVGALYLPDPVLYVSEAAKLLDPSGKLADQRTIDQIKKLLTAFGAWIDRVGKD